MGIESGGSKGSFGTHGGAVKTIAMTGVEYPVGSEVQVRQSAGCTK